MTTFKSRVGRVVIPMLPVNRRAFDILRHELQAWRTRLGNGLSPSYHRSVRQFQEKRGLSLNVGSGGRGLADWVNIEMRRHRDTTLCLDIRRPLPFATGSVRRILAEHVIEHVDFRDDLPVMLQEFLRVLEPGGVVRIVVPDGERFLKAYASGDAAVWHQLGVDLEAKTPGLSTPMQIVNHVFHQGGEHLYAYDFETLASALKTAGFAVVIQQSYRVSSDAALAIDQANHAPYSLYVEATKANGA